jgi:LmbE family N-acetylglucosaminyl deacetylase
MAVLTRPDDESLGVGGTLAKYASEGVEVFLLTATRGDGGRYRGLPPGDPQHPGPVALANIREKELRAAASVLGVHDVAVLDYPPISWTWKRCPRSSRASDEPSMLTCVRPRLPDVHALTWNVNVGHIQLAD